MGSPDSRPCIRDTHQEHHHGCMAGQVLLLSAYGAYRLSGVERAKEPVGVRDRVPMVPRVRRCVKFAVKVEVTVEVNVKVEVYGCGQG